MPRYGVLHASDEIDAPDSFDSAPDNLNVANSTAIHRQQLHLVAV